VATPGAASETKNAGSDAGVFLFLAVIASVAKQSTKLQRR
jgi:hypothetical protein